MIFTSLKITYTLSSAEVPCSAAAPPPSLALCASYAATVARTRSTAVLASAQVPGALLAGVELARDARMRQLLLALAGGGASTACEGVFASTDKESITFKPLAATTARLLARPSRGVR